MGSVGGWAPRSERSGAKSIWCKHGGAFNLFFHCPRDSCSDFFLLGICDAVSRCLGSNRVHDNQHPSSFEWQHRTGFGPCFAVECIIGVASKRKSHTEPWWVDCEAYENQPQLIGKTRVAESLSNYEQPIFLSHFAKPKLRQTFQFGCWDSQSKQKRGQARYKEYCDNVNTRSQYFAHTSQVNVSRNPN